MMKNLLILLFAFVLTLSLNGQLQVSVQDSGVNELHYDLSDGGDKKIGYSVLNKSDETVEWYWSVEPVDGFPDGWTFQVCDTRNCYDYGVARTPDNRPNTSEPSTQTSFDQTYVHVLSNGISGSSHMILKIYDNPDFEDPIFVSSIPTSTSNVNLDDLKLFPNPTSDYFSINDDKEVKNISIYNIVGKEVKSFAHAPGLTHDVKELRNGMYLVRLMNDDNQVLKTMRLSKR